MDKPAIDKAKDHFGKILEDQMIRMEKIKAMPDWIDLERSQHRITLGRIHQSRLIGV